MAMLSRPTPDRRVVRDRSELPRLSPTLRSDRPSIRIGGGRGAGSESVGQAIPDARWSWGRCERAWKGMDMDWESGDGEDTGA